MFPKPQRLPSLLVGNVIRQGKRMSIDGCELHLLPTSGDISRFAVVIPLSTHKRAVKRNLLRRRIRESLRHASTSSALAGKSYDCVCFGRKELLRKTQPEIEKILTRLLVKPGYTKKL